ncbi:c-type cytochrome [Geoalkalibacter sp.]|uniref:c-type cytochrome n=1 Tax=Geoalkalibacter sp. TaxID=3041440 RepID=UPI00272E29E4|nr:c-type cytochrome [Geoalkalibacter sp.]
MTPDHRPSSPDNNRPPPRWINIGLGLAALFALGAALLAISAGLRHPSRHEGPIADLTFNLGGREVREHCTTCHLDGGPPHTALPHPDIAPHSPETLGCTGCHLGEGMALDERLSHGRFGRGARQVLSGRDVQGRCYACHQLAPLEGAERSWQGYVLFQEKACDLCHRLDGAGGNFGPDLSRIGSQLGLEALHEAIRDPRLEPPNSIMPRFPLSRGEIRDLAWFLKSRVADPLYATPMQVQAGLVRLPEIALVPDDVELQPGEELLYRGKCLACHKFGEEDGNLAPDLSSLGLMRAPEFIRGFLESPHRLIPGAIMPPSPLDEAQRTNLSTFLAEEATAHAHHVQTRQLYMHLCQRCHAADGTGRGPIEPNLATFPRAFAGNAEFFHRAPDQRLRKSLEQGIPGTSMPPYGKLLEEPRREELLDLLFAAFIGIERGDKRSLAGIPPRPERVASPERADALYAVHCLRCHGRGGTGKGPEYLQHLPRPRNLTNRPYFAAQDDEGIARAIVHGIAGTAMPPVGEKLDAAEIWGLVARIRQWSGGAP